MAHSRWILRLGIGGQPQPMGRPCLRGASAPDGLGGVANSPLDPLERSQPTDSLGEPDWQASWFLRDGLHNSRTSLFARTT